MAYFTVLGNHQLKAERDHYLGFCQKEVSHLPQPPRGMRLPLGSDHQGVQFCRKVNEAETAGVFRHLNGVGKHEGLQLLDQSIYVFF